MRNLLTIVFFSINILAIAHTKLDKHFSYKHYTTYDGLSQSQVTHLYKCSRGYLWICTKDGVNRFDGKNFKIFKNEIKSSKFNHVSKIFEYNELYYFITQNEITVYEGIDLIKKAVIPFPEGFSSPFWDEHVSFIENDTLYFWNCNFTTKDNWIYKHLLFSLANNQLDTFNISTRCVKKIIDYKDKKLVICDSCIYEIQGKQLVLNQTLSKKYYGYIEKKNECCWAYSGKKKSIYQLDFKGDTVLESKVDMGFDFQIKHSNKFAFFNIEETAYFKDESKLFHSLKGNTHKELLTIDICNSVIEDDQKNLWVGTEDGIYNIFNQLFEEYTFNIGTKTDNVWTILQDDTGTMWFCGYETGMWTLNTDDEITRIVPEGIGLNKKACWSFSKQYMGGCRDNKGNLFFPFAGHIMVKTTNNFFTIRSNSPLFLFNDEKNKRILSWGTDNFQISKTNWKPIPIPGETSTIVSCVETKDGNYLLGSFNHQYIYNNEVVVALPDTFAYKGVVSMASDSLYNIWKGTTSGLYLSSVNGEQQIAQKQIGNLSIGSVYRYKNLLFVGAGRSLFMLDIAQYYKNGDQRVKVFNQYNGFIAMDDAQNGFFLDRDSFLWYPAVDKVIRFKPEELAATPFSEIPIPLIVSLTASDINNEKYTFYEPDSTVQLSKNLNSLRFEFFASDFNHPDDINYRYKLIGYDKNWSRLTKETSAVFTNLNKGNYHMEVQCSIDKENWSPIIRSATYSIAPYWWQLWYVKTVFFLLTMLILILLITFFVKARQQQFIQKLEEQRRLNELRLQSIRSKHIPHFSGNALSNIEHYIFNSDLRQANKYLSKYSKLMNITLRDADLASRNIKQELEYVTLYLELEKMRFQDKIEYSFNVDPRVDLSTRIPNMLLHTWVENAIKHGIRHLEGVGKIEIRITLEHPNLYIAVLDNGIGRKKAKDMNTSGSGNGLKILSEQLNIYNHFNPLKAKLLTTDLKKQNGSVAGTCFELILPLVFKFEN